MPLLGTSAARTALGAKANSTPARSAPLTKCHRRGGRGDHAKVGFSSDPPWIVGCTIRCCLSRLGLCRRPETVARHEARHRPSGLSRSVDRRGMARTSVRAADGRNEAGDETSRSLRRDTPVLVKMWLRWVRAVASVMPSADAASVRLAPATRCCEQTRLRRRQTEDSRHGTDSAGNAAPAGVTNTAAADDAPPRRRQAAEHGRSPQSNSCRPAGRRCPAGNVAVGLRRGDRAPQLLGRLALQRAETAAKRNDRRSERRAYVARLGWHAGCVPVRRR